MSRSPRPRRCHYTSEPASTKPPAVRRVKHKDNIPQAKIRAKDERTREEARVIADGMKAEERAALDAAAELLKPAREAARNKTGA
jgi:hypothetical protein